jgi:hypothetical protein
MRQERFASSAAYERPLLANLVAKRCSVLKRGEDRDLVWFLQLLSHQAGGMKGIAAELRERFADRLATPSMKRIGTKPGQIYNAGEVEKVRDEIPAGLFEFRLKGELDDRLIITAPVCPSDPLERWDGEWQKKSDRIMFQAAVDAAKQPSTYAASDFLNRCHEAATDDLEKHILNLCLDPEMPIEDGSPWYFPALVSTLREFQAGWVKLQSPVAVTSIGRKIFDALDYTLETGECVIIDGVPRIGKSHATKAWCRQRPGRVRYVEMEASNDEISFFQQIAASLGLSIPSNSKAQDLKVRIKGVLQTKQLMLVLDEAHMLWPQTLYRHALPNRITWLNTVLLNNEVSVALVTTPQFWRSQNEVEKLTCWTGAQFTGRIGKLVNLPNSLSNDDLAAVAKAWIPYADVRMLKSLVSHAQMSSRYLAAIKAVVKQARYDVSKAGRERIEFRDIIRVIDESVIPSDTAFNTAMKAAERPTRKPVARVYAQPLQEDFSRCETAKPEPAGQRNALPNSEPRTAVVGAGAGKEAR